MQQEITSHNTNRGMRMTTFPPRRTLPSSSSASDAAGEARSLPRLEDDPREAPAPDPAAALLSLAARSSHLRAPSPGRSGHTYVYRYHRYSLHRQILSIPDCSDISHQTRHDPSVRAGEEPPPTLHPKEGTRQWSGAQSRI
jgi:hypothetical protein